MSGARGDDARSAHCIGVDGARSGWLAVWQTHHGLAHALHPSAQALCAMHANAAVMAVDVPIGLADAGPRAPDRLARAFVGGRRACSVFSAPVRGILDATSQPDASRRHRAIDGRGFGAQAYALLPKIREWDETVSASAALAERVYEVHPEVSFAALREGAGLAERKKSAAGRALRQALLEKPFGQRPVAELLAAVPRAEAAADDVLDALVAHWSARRIADGVAGTLPTPPVRDAAGLRTAIHY